MIALQAKLSWVLVAVVTDKPATCTGGVVSACCVIFTKVSYHIILFALSVALA